MKRRAIQPVKDGQPWWTRAAVPLPAPQASSLPDVDGLMPQLAMIPSMETAKTSNTPKTQADVTGESLSAQPDPHASEAATTTPMTAQDVLQDLAKHYLETLYLSRTSLAYFTKGPLSRARAALAASAEPGGLQASELIAFLRDAVLTASVMDKKYRDGIAGIVKELPAPGLETAEQPANAKKKRKWKAKRDKHGFFADEQVYVARWWWLDDQAGCAPGSAETAEAMLRRRTPRLRSRETYLQINLALEVLALEALSTPAPIAQALNVSGTGEPLQAPLQTQGPETQAEERKKPKVKKLQDLPALLETLIERVCIWHSLDSSSPATSGGPDADHDAESGNDEMKDFCTEVVIPFYMHRIPLHAATVNKKFGGPSAPTPATKRKSTGSVRKPGEPAVRTAPERSRKPLSRVASEARAHGSSRAMPSLHRSATDTDALLAHIKRENSETPAPLDAIPAATKVPQPRKRTSLMHSMSFNRREVDLSAMSQVNAAKARKKADVEEKLRDAISTLKKPNRARAVEEVATNADLSFAKATARSSGRGSGAQPAQKTKVAAAAGREGVHVSATPARNAQFHRNVKVTPSHYSHNAAPQTISSSAATTHIPSSSARLLARPSHEPPPSSTFAVPQTGHRPRHSGAAARGGVEETPSRGFAKFMPPGLACLPGTLESPVTARQQSQGQGSVTQTELPAVETSPSVSRKRAPAAVVGAQTPTKPVRSLSLFTPSQQVSSVPLVAASPNVLRTEAVMREDRAGMANQEGKSVYDALGWEDEYEELT